MEVGSILTASGETYVSRIDLIDWFQEFGPQFEKRHCKLMADWFVRALSAFGECPLDLDEGNCCVLEINAGPQDSFSLNGIHDEEHGTFFKIQDLTMLAFYQADEVKSVYSKREWGDIDEAVKKFAALMDEFVEEIKEGTDFE